MARRPTTQLTDRRLGEEVIRPTSVEMPDAQAEAETGAAVRVERFVRPIPNVSHCRNQGSLRAS